MIHIGCDKKEPCKMKLKSNKPIFQPPFRVPPSRWIKSKTLIDQTISEDMTKPNRSNYAAPVFLISPKKCKGHGHKYEH